MSEAVTVPSLMMFSIVSEESLVRDTHTHKLGNKNKIKIEGENKNVKKPKKHHTMREKKIVHASVFIVLFCVP